MLAFPMIYIYMLINPFRYLAPFHTLPDLTEHFHEGVSCQLPPVDYAPQSSKDPVLTSFAQLGALRLNAARCLISLIDSTKQYCLAEATRTLSLQNDTIHESEDQLWLGAAIIPRSRGVCEHVLSSQPLDSDQQERGLPSKPLVIKDLSKDERFNSPNTFSSYINRFYAGVPIYSPAGTTIGVYCIFDNDTREALSDTQERFLHDMSQTVTNYLSTCKTREDNRLKEQMLRGLGSFVQGMTQIKSHEFTEASISKDLIEPVGEVPKSPGHQTSGRGVKDVETVSNSEGPLPHRSQMPLPPTALPSDEGSVTGYTNHADRKVESLGSDGTYFTERPPSRSSRRRVGKSVELNDTLQPKGAKALFSRAANVLRQSSNFSGVLFLDASVSIQPGDGRSRRPRDGYARKGSVTTDTQSSGPESRSSHEFSSGNDSDGPTVRINPHSDKRSLCSVLGYSLEEQASSSDHDDSVSTVSLTEGDLLSLLKKYANGKILLFDATGNFASTDGSGSDGQVRRRKRVSAKAEGPVSEGTSEKARHLNIAIGNLAQGARCMMILPLWHYEKERWSSVAVCWTTDEHRIFSANRELLFLRIFGNSIMNGLGRLDAMISEKAKTTFLSSISHELRSPLHGILGGAEFLMESSVDGFQADMIGSIQQCGRTLLDTVDNVLDFTKINDFTQTRGRNFRSVRRLQSGVQRGGKIQNRSLGYLRSPLLSDLDLSIITEEVVDAVFASQSYRMLERGWDVTSEKNDFEVESPNGLQLVASEREAERKRVRITLDMPKGTHWVFKAQPGAWRRILMNLIGNALKFTDKGFINVVVRMQDIPNEPDLCEVKLTVTDTGRGIAREYLKSKLFTPFSQQDPFAPGTGLGMSIVRQLVDTMSGDIDIKSEEGIGTTVKVYLAMAKGEAADDSAARWKRTRLSEIAQDLKMKKVCVLDRPALPSNEPLPSSRGHGRFGSSLATTLKDWFDVDVIYTDTWSHGLADIVICPEPSFENLALMQNAESPESVPRVIFISLDAIEASALRNDARIMGSVKPVEIITQP